MGRLLFCMFCLCGGSSSRAPGESAKLQRRKESHQSLAEWPRKRKAKAVSLGANLAESAMAVVWAFISLILSLGKIPFSCQVFSSLTSLSRMPALLRGPELSSPAHWSNRGHGQVGPQGKAGFLFF